MVKKYQVVISRRAKRDLKKLDIDIKRQIIKSAKALADNPRPHSSKLMKGNYKGFRRERTGDYRIIYEIKDRALLILVIRAGHRKKYLM